MKEYSTEKVPHGKLKIFFGYYAKVGKTYTMLSAAQSAKKNGIDSVIGFIAPQNQTETEGVKEGLETLNTLLHEDSEEFDLDGALKRMPKLILVDELAHKNAPGLRHLNRYDDVEELLNAGIDVYSTVNVQNIESLYDIVKSITHCENNETIPDFIFDNADQVEFVDEDPDELIYRLCKGEGIISDKAAQRVHYAQLRENLIALREIALRRMADRVNQISLKEAEKGASAGKEHILVCLNTSPSNAKVIRAAARMASAFHAKFTALYVENIKTEKLASEEDLMKNMKLAQQLGAGIATVFGNDITRQTVEYAKASAVTKIVVGYAATSKFNFQRPSSFIDKLLEQAPNIDVHVITYTEGNSLSTERGCYNLKITYTDLLKTILILTLCTVAGMFFYHSGIREANIITIYILGVLIIASQTKSKLTCILSSVAGVLVFNFFFTVPRFTFQAYGTDYPITFSVMLISSLITSTLTMRVRTQARESSKKAYRTEILLETNRNLQKAKTVEGIIEEGLNQLSRLLRRDIFVRITEGVAFLPPRFLSINTDIFNPSKFETTEELSAALWVAKNKKEAGRSSVTLPNLEALYLPVANYGEVYGVLGIALNNGEYLEPFERSLLDAMLIEMAAAIEKFKLNELQERAAMEAEKERLRANLLRAISHDLRTPLTSISGNASVMLSNESRIDEPTKRRLCQDIYDDSLWLINLVENLLAITKLENGSMGISMRPELVDEVIDEALKHIQKKDGHKITVKGQEELLLIIADARLLIQVIINIVDNAVKYTDEGSHIIVSYFRHKDKVVIEIKDDGQGISDEEKEKVFDMFYTTGNALGDSRRGLGLGLALCKSIINAHGSEIFLHDNMPHGTIFSFELKMKEVTEYE